MQNINIQVNVSSGFSPHAPHITPRTPRQVPMIVFILGCFGGSSIPRSTCIVQIPFHPTAGFLLWASFVNALGKLTGFETVVVKLAPMYDGSRTAKFPQYDKLDGHLKVLLGGAREEGRHFEDKYYCMAYHPRRVARLSMASV